MPFATAPPAPGNSKGEQVPELGAVSYRQLDTQLRCMQSSSNEALVELLLHFGAGTTSLESVSRYFCHGQAQR
jgi:hypothetical protein